MHLSGSMQEYGWVPILTSELFINGEPLSRINDIEELFILGYPKWDNLSDKSLLDKIIGWWLRRWRKNLHRIYVVPEAFRLCGECGERVLKLSVKVEDYMGGLLLQGCGDIHKTGLVRYEVQESNVKVSSDKVKQPDYLHLFVRDVFHQHIHHSTDMPLPTVEGMSEEVAIGRLMEEYQEKAIYYKADISKKFGSKWLGLKRSFEAMFNIYSRAKGELVYMNAFCRIFGRSEEKVVLDLERSLSVLGEKIMFRQSRSEHLDQMTFLLLSIAAVVVSYLGKTHEALGLWSLIVVLLWLPLLRAVRDAVGGDA